MARPIIGTLEIPTFVSTGTPGEYTFTDAIYNNQADATGNAAFDLAVGFVVFIPATDINTAQPIPGLAHRYKLTAVTTTDGVSVDGTIEWYETVPIMDLPTNGATCIVSQPSIIKKYGFLVSELVYGNVPAGVPTSSYNIDTEQITDRDAFTEYHVITSAEATAKKFLLQNSPYVQNSVVVDVIGGAGQDLGVDFEIVNDEFRWGGLGLDGILDVGDIVRLRYT
jgi:hypothetical protein